MSRNRTGNVRQGLWSLIDGLARAVGHLVAIVRSFSHRPLPSKKASRHRTNQDDLFNGLFQLGTLKETYSVEIEPKRGRGIDRLGVAAFSPQQDEQLGIAQRKCTAGVYHFSPYREKLIARGALRNPRQLSVPTLRDRVVLFQLKTFLQSVFPEQVGRTLPNEHIRHIKTFYSASAGTPLGVIRADIKSFYENIRHDLLLDHLANRIQSRRALELVRRSIRMPTLGPFTLKKDRRNKRNIHGIPQGLAISNILASIYLTSFDEVMRRKSLFYARYVDDLIIITPRNQLDTVGQELDAELARVGLTQNYDKSFVGQLFEEFEFLGYSLALPRVTVRPGTVERFLRSLAAKFSAYRYKSLEGSHPGWLSVDARKRAFLDEVNEKLTGAISEARKYGWIFYFLEITDLALLHRLDAVAASFFRRLNDFGGSRPPGLKKLSRAYYEAKFSPDRGYIHNYNRIKTPTQMLGFMIDRGIVDPADAAIMTVDDVVKRFMAEKKKTLSTLELDVGFLY